MHVKHYNKSTKKYKQTYQYKHQQKHNKQYNQQHNIKQNGGNIFLETILGIENEKDLSCFLAKQEFLQDYVIELLYDTFMLFIKNGNANLNMIKELLLVRTEIHNSQVIIKDIGYIDEIFVNTLIHTINSNKKIHFFKNLFKDKPLKFIHINLGILYKFYTPNKPLFKYLIFNDPTLYEPFIDRLQKLFNLPQDFKFEDFNIFFDSIVDQTLLGSIMIMGTEECYDSAYRRNLTYQNYVREQPNPIQYTSIYNITECEQDLKVGEKVGIYMADNTYKITPKTLTYHLYNKYKQPYLSGPSGSAVLLFYFITKVLKKEPHIAILLISIIDFIPIHHTLPEILQTLITEYIKVKVLDETEPYTLDLDPIEYIKKIIINNIDTIITLETSNSKVARSKLTSNSKKKSGKAAAN